ncbi:MAG TPA: bifunctional riboflavin kinase/FAD synthetase [Flavobacteriaceae bacterium]|nr:bifunctional riboflavin kinase/FAD synthetase [Flavobacteriaceae bacterium]
MQVFKKASFFDKNIPTAVTIGTFDGVHVGHRKILCQLVELAEKEDLESTLLTFFPHPRMVLQSESDIKLINTIEEKKRILEHTGIDNLVIHPFSVEFSRLSARDFVEKILVKALNAKKVIIGYDHRFGRNRTANIEDLKIFGEEFNFEVKEISKEEIEETTVSSTKIRKALENGEIEKANAYLGAPFMLTGKVIRGKNLGKKLGFPTANLEIKEPYKLIPKNGVYVVSSIIDGKKTYGMMSIGTNPTVGLNNPRSIETHFFDFDANLYEQTLQIDLLAKIREEQKFDTLQQLSDAMEKDREYSHKFIRNQEPLNPSS